MKNTILYLSPIAFIATSCVQDEATGEMEPTWLFWVFLGILVFCLLFGVLYNAMKSKKNDSDSKTRYEKEIEGYEEALKKKEEENKDDSVGSN